MGFTIAAINQMPQPSFVTTLGAIFENTPEIAQQTWHHRPFSNVADLHQQMVNTMNAMDFAAQLALIQAHPDLGSKTKMADASSQEQAGVGLDRLNPEEFAQFQILNQQYVDRFGFPFIIAVKNQTKTSILEAFIRRLDHEKDAEMQQALTEIAEIARLRLMDLVK
jgi:2-oxo-4-hydroxy-4-carboxy-5-ureidoimidazoline decarboxylase